MNKNHAFFTNYTYKGHKKEVIALLTAITKYEEDFEEPINYSSLLDNASFLYDETYLNSTEKMNEVYSIINNAINYCIHKGYIHSRAWNW